MIKKLSDSKMKPVLNFQNDVLDLMTSKYSDMTNEQLLIGLANVIEGYLKLSLSNTDFPFDSLDRLSIRLMSGKKALIDANFTFSHYRTIK